MRVPNRHKLRQEYLKRKAGAYSLILWNGLELLFLTIVTLCFGLFACVSFFFAIAIQEPRLMFIPGMMVLFALAAGNISWESHQFYQKAIQEKATLLHVPPVRPDTLPAEEVLVRGSQEPTLEQSGVLLRAARESAWHVGRTAR